MMLTEEEFRLFRNLIYDESGIYIKEARKDFLESRVYRRMAETNTASPYWYYRLVTEKKNGELPVLLDRLTINETSFFRNRPQMDIFKNMILPEIFSRKTAGKTLRIWSAGCSTGEEPYSIAMIVSEELRFRSGWDARIYASDLSMNALAAAARGEYPEDKICAVVDDHLISRHFDRVKKNASAGVMKIRDETRKMVVFDYHNLKNENGLSDLDVIFCRNVMIYFDEEEQRRLVEKFHRSLSDGGYLLIGHAESLQGMNAGFQFMYADKGIAYKKTERGIKS